MSLRTARTVATRALAWAAAGLVVAVLTLTVVLPRLGGGHAYTILTASMEPGLPPGTVVVVRKTPTEDIRTGDVITYQLRSGDPTVVTHRVRGTTIAASGERAFVTQGDANDSPDANPVTSVQIKGVQWYSVPYLGYPSLKLGGDLRQVVVMGSVALLLGYAATMLLGDLRDKRRSRVAAAASPGEARERVDA
jgi:signal peptidase